MRSGGYVICRLSRILGHGVPPYQIASSAIVAMISFFYIYTVASHLQLRIYPLVDRVTYYINFQAYVISEYADHVILGGLLLSWLAITIKRSGATHIGVLMLGAILIVSLIMMIDTALDAIALASLPIIIALALCKTYLQKKILKYLNLGLVIEYVCIIGVIFVYG